MGRGFLAVLHRSSALPPPRFRRLGMTERSLSSLRLNNPYCAGTYVGSFVCMSMTEA